MGDLSEVLKEIYGEKDYKKLFGEGKEEQKQKQLNLLEKLVQKREKVKDLTITVDDIFATMQDEEFYYAERFVKSINALEVENLKVIGIAPSSCRCLFCYCSLCDENTGVLEFTGVNCKKIDLSELDMTDVIDFSDMFNNCFHLQEVIGFEEEKDYYDKKGLGNMFYGCYSLENINLKGFLRENDRVEDIFFETEHLKNIYLPQKYVDSLSERDFLRKINKMKGYFEGISVNNVELDTVYEKVVGKKVVGKYDFDKILNDLDK